MIYTIGDSHTWSFRDNPDYRVLHLGARTAHQIEQHDDIVMTRVQHIRDGCKMLWILGEIDCRIHILLKHHQTKKSVRNLIIETVNKYLMYISKFNGKYAIYVMNIVPPGIQPNIYDYPTYGTRAQLKKIYESYNAELKKQCEMLCIPFVDIYDQMIGKDGYRKPELVSDDIHLNNVISKMVFNKYFKG